MVSGQLDTSNLETQRLRSCGKLNLRLLEIEVSSLEFYNRKEIIFA